MRVRGRARRAALGVRGGAGAQGVCAACLRGGKRGFAARGWHFAGACARAAQLRRCICGHARAATRGASLAWQQRAYAASLRRFADGVPRPEPVPHAVGDAPGFGDANAYGQRRADAHWHPRGQRGWHAAAERDAQPRAEPDAVAGG